MPRTLVTGATGFVGSNVVAQLRQRGWEVGCLVRDAARGAPLKQLGATLHVGRLGNRESLERAVAGVETVFHVAGRVRALAERQFREDNLDGTRNLIEACATQLTPPVVVLVSSLAAGGPSRLGNPRKETDFDQPVSDYGRSKLAAEGAARALADEVPISVLRPPIIFGPADRASLPIFQSVRWLRLHLVPGFRRFPVSIVHVADLCDALIRIAENGARLTKERAHAAQSAEGIYYVAAERTIDYGEMGKLAAKAIGSSAIVLPIPKALFWMIGTGAEVVGQLSRRPGTLNLDKVREALATGWECSDEKIRCELDYAPATSLENRFVETAAWYREAGWLR